MNENRAEKIEEWSKKGAQWCATELWKARRELSTVREDRERERRQRRSAEAERYNSRLEKKANAIMASVLEDNGIRPVKLRVTYLDVDCENCPNRGDEYGNEWNCQGCGEADADGVFRETEKRVIESMAFYTYKIDGDTLSGITSHFEESDYDLLKVVDERTGEVLYERETDGTEKEQQDV